MNRKVLAVFFSMLMFQGCNSGNQPTASIDQEPQTIIESANTGDSPMFSDKLKMGKAYKVKDAMRKYARNSICGTSDLQGVNSYDGKLGQTIDFVKAHQSAVGAMEETGTDSSSKFCTGTMISEDLFITASHCVEDGTPTNNFVAFNYEKAKGTGKLLPQSHFKILEVVEEGGSNKTDYSILRLDGKPGLKFGFTKVNAAPTKEGDLLTIIQHPSGRAKEVEVGHRSKTISGVYMGYGDLDTEPGSSGSGVLNATGEVVGIHTNGGCTSNGGENKAVMMTEIAKVSKTIQKLAIR